MSNNWTENRTARDAAFRAGKQAHASGTDVVPEKFSTQDLRSHFLRGYDIAAWKAARSVLR
jgi:hypothetical protein